MKQVILAVMLSALAGCASVSGVDGQSKVGTILIPDNAVVCVVYPADGQFNGEVYRSSGVKVGEVIFKSVPKKFSPVVVKNEQNCESNYLLTSEILEYENRATGWSGKPDKIKVKVIASNPQSGELSTFTYSADTNVATSAFFEWGNPAPYKLLGSGFTKQVVDLLDSQ